MSDYATTAGRQDLPPLAQPDAPRAARAYRARGWWAIPIPAREKGPRLPKWQDARIDADDNKLYFRPESNIGLILGEPSGGLVDVDLDCVEARQLAPELLPATGMIHGRASSPRSHYWYVASSAPAGTVRHEAPDGSTIVELRSTGGQTVVPPSVHPLGERLGWAAAGEPAQVDVAHLDRAVRLIAAGVLLLRAWRVAPPVDQARLIDATRVAMIEAGWQEAEIADLVEAVESVGGAL
ncbi:MAG: bifunctional DNA primase/polymerase [Planctomycetota bacterium]|nr:bifunctional DNA primase/polymerase [Planctomycetota bacterium]